MWSEVKVQNAEMHKKDYGPTIQHKIYLGDIFFKAIEF